jgi:hypothetical protein
MHAGIAIFGAKMAENGTTRMQDDRGKGQLRIQEKEFQGFP